MNRRYFITLAVIVVFVVFSGYVNWPDNPGLNLGFGNTRLVRELRYHLGLDLRGGLHVVLRATPGEDQEITSDHMEATRDIIAERVNALGVSEPIVQLEGTDRIIVELPGVENPDEAIALFRETGELAFVDLGASSVPPVPVGGLVEGEQYRRLFTGAMVKSAEVGFDERSLPQITFELKDEGAVVFEEFTSQNICVRIDGAPCTWLGITLDDILISAATISSTISNRGRITGSFTLEEVREIVIKLKYGALPVPLEIAQNRTVGPTLGKDSVDRSLRAGIIGLALVAVFMLIYYRLPGVVATVALIIYALLVLGIFKLWPVVLTLAGIAGFILSVGMAVDANILIFERLKEELRRGRTLRSALDVGFERAWTSIRDSNISTLITCAVLFYFGSGIVRGFAITLAIGVIISMFTAITVTRTFLYFVVRLPKLREHQWLYGVGQPQEENATPRQTPPQQATEP